MSKASHLIDLINTLLESNTILESIPNLTIKNKIKLSVDIKSNKNKIIPKNSIVDVIKVNKKGNVVEIEIESIDDEQATLTFKTSDNFPHKVVK